MGKMEVCSDRTMEEPYVATEMQSPAAAPAYGNKENQVPGIGKDGKKRGTKTSTTGATAVAVVAFPAQSRLLSLPAEIRHMIVGYLTKDPGERRRYQDLPPSFCRLPPRLRQRKFGMAVKAAGAKYPVYVHQPVDISILLVCRQMYHDAVAVLFKAQEIHVEVGDSKALTRFNRNVMPTLPPSIRGGPHRLHIHVKFANRFKSQKPMAVHIQEGVRAAIKGINQLAFDLPQTPLASLKISWFESLPLLTWEDRKRILSTLKKLRPRQVEIGALEARRHPQWGRARFPDKEGTTADDLRLAKGTHRFEVDYLQTLVIKRCLPVLAPEKKYALELAAEEAYDGLETEL
jgi:hypothetical protein